MAEFCEVMKQEERMCNYMKNNCAICSLCSSNNGKGLVCGSFLVDYSQEAEKIIMDWAKEHPVMTNADKFKEVFGIEIAGGYEKCDMFECEDCGCENCSHYGFWDMEYVEPKKENEDGKID